MENFKWEIPEKKEMPVGDGDLRIVNLPVKCIFQWSDKIIADYDSETDTILEYKSGYIMQVIHDQEFIFNDEKTIFISGAFFKKTT